MRIKRIDLIGFKSFSDKVNVDLQAALTCVVGPNGCGKSNIVDALRWTMGEQSARHLRGKAMGDVISSTALIPAVHREPQKFRLHSKTMDALPLSSADIQKLPSRVGYIAMVRANI